MQNSSLNQVSLDKMGLKINGQYTILLCASLFYFRVPEGLWQDRMKRLRFAGYNCIDVYFPWNYHEIEKDKWVFSGQRDVDKFLSLAKEEGFYVVARPGPYICSEWDGGGLPAYLFAEEDIKIRDNDHQYLSYVSKWYDHILPIIAKHQVTRGGSVVLVQLENELDFFECEDRQGYMRALKQMADKHGIEVPCIACAGQGDLYGAWGQVEGIVPSMNLYLDSKLPDMEQELEYYCKQLYEMDIPLLVTETGRDHFLLRRLLSSGAKLLGPYNQVAGTNFGFTNSVNNWGRPVAFLTSNYDFKSLVNSFGEISEEIYEARLLSSFIKTMGQSLAGAARVFGECDIAVEPNGVLGYSKLPVLSLFQNEYAGFVVPVTNTGDKPVDVTIINGSNRWPQKTKMTIPPYKSRFVLFNCSLGNWGLPGVIKFASAEPCFVSKEDEKVVIVFHADYEGEVHFDFGEYYDGLFTFVFRSDSERREEVILSNGKRIILYGIPSSKAAMLSKATVHQLYYYSEDCFKSNNISNHCKINWFYDNSMQENFDSNVCTVYSGQKAIHMEKAGLYRGYGLYEGYVKIPENCSPLGVLLHNAADVVSLYCNGTYLGTSTPGGEYAFIDLSESLKERDLYFTIRTEIWGHSNFDDARKPALRIKSLRGFDGATLIFAKERIHLWNLKVNYREYQPYDIKIGFGGWLTTRKPVQCTYYKKVNIKHGAERHFLLFENIQCSAVVKVNDKYAGEVDIFRNWVDISPFVEGKNEVEISVEVDKRYYAEPAGRVYLLSGVEINNWTLKGYDEKNLWQVAWNKFSEQLNRVTMPFTLQPGSVSWLFGEVEASKPHRCYVLKFTGKNVKLTVFFNGTIVGRIWLPSPNRPPMVGGVDNVAYLPGCWFNENDNKIAIMLEAVVKEQEGVIEAIEIQPVNLFNEGGEQNF